MFFEPLPLAAVELNPVVFVIAKLLIGGAFLLSFYRVIKGPDAVDRVVVLDLMTGIFICLVLFHAIETGAEVYLNVAIALAIISFVGTVALARYLEQNKGDGRG